MGLNIKNQEAHHLAERLAGLTGESLTTAAVEALSERLTRIEREREDEDLVERLLAIGREYGADMREPYRSMDPNEFLYDERGLPK